ncbi:MAG: hypothetical protein N2746_04510 [Deltaproteobacteria bacterium]|nr:hypothetical protein [Deltaproteobacteria bacterium]
MVGFNLNFSEDNKWFYLRIKKGDEVIVWSAPFYYEKPVSMDGGIDAASDEDIISDAFYVGEKLGYEGNNGGCGCSFLR